jgi:AraC-like DNA-binding protein
MKLIKIKNMVCNRCILTVKELLDKLAIEYLSISLGTIELPDATDRVKLDQLANELKKIGFVVLNHRNIKIIEEINRAIHLYIELSSDSKRSSLSLFITSQVPYRYSYLSTLYSATEGKTIEQVYLESRIRKAKELLINTSYTLREIASYLGYGSIQYLSNQFRQHTGMSPIYYKKLNRHSLGIPLEII